MSANKTTVRRTTTPQLPCPSWCELPADHEPTPEDAVSDTVSVTVGDIVSDSYLQWRTHAGTVHHGAASFEVEAAEIVETGGPVKYFGPVRINMHLPDTDPKSDLVVVADEITTVARDLRLVAFVFSSVADVCDPS